MFDKNISDEERNFLAQEELQRQQLDSQSDLNRLHTREQDQHAQAILIKSLDPSAVVEQIKRDLKGQILIDNRLVQERKPLMNDEGISTMISFVRVCVNPSTTISHLESENVTKIMDGLSRDVVLNLQLNWRKYEMEKTNMDLVNNLILIPSFIALRRATGGGERSFLKSSMSEQVSSRISPYKDKGGGFWSKFRL